MSNSLEEIIKAIIFKKNGKEFQKLVWDILICQYPDFQTPEMNHDLGNDGYSIKERLFVAVYAPEKEYDNKKTVKKISNSNSKDLGDYEKFVNNWKNKYEFEVWVFLTKEDLKGLPHQKLVDLNNNGDGIKKENWGLQQILSRSLSLNEKDIRRIYNLQEDLFPQKLKRSNEVETIIDLIEYISANNELTEGDFENSLPDPDRKIYNRFKEYCKSIENEIKEYALYANAIFEAETTMGLDTITVAKIRGFLKCKSKRFLRECSDNPMNALDALSDYLDNELKVSNKNYDHNAIRYYLISEIPKCNVFPNE